MNEIATRNTGSFSLTTEEARKQLRATFGRGKNGIEATDEEWSMFEGLAVATGLNPYTREIWLVPAEGKNKERYTMIMIGIAGFRKIANLHPQYDGIETELFYSVKGDSIPYRGVSKVYRKDRTRPDVVELFFSETCRKGFDGKPIQRWAEAPRAQFTKCLEAAALRKAFPILNGSYLPEEVGYNEQKGVFEGEIVGERPQEKLERKISAWVGNEEISTAGDYADVEHVKEEIPKMKSIYEYEVLTSDSKFEQILAYAEKEKAEVEMLEDRAVIRATHSLSRLTSFEKKEED